MPSPDAAHSEAAWGMISMVEEVFLAIVEVERDAHQVHSVRRPFQSELDFGVISVNYDFADLVDQAGAPS